MARPPDALPWPPSSILFESRDRTVVVVDVPRSIEEAQEASLADEGGAGGAIAAARPRRRRRLLSAPAPAEPFPAPPEPRRFDAERQTGRSFAAQLAELTTRAAVESGRGELGAAGFDGPWHLPRQHTRSGRALIGGGDASPDMDLDGVYVPPGSRCLSGTIAACRDEFLREAPQFDLIVLDPPWPNRSARRRRQGRKRKSAALDGSETGKEAAAPVGSGDDAGYDAAHDMESLRAVLEQIPVGAKLAGRGGLVAVWVTNKPDCEALLTDPRCGVFRGWGVELVALWTWLKVTAPGEPVVPVDSQWRKPWERLLLARRPTGGRGTGSGDDAGSSTNTPPPLPRHRLIVGVPDVHSRKPNLRPLVAPFLTPASASEPGRSIVGLEVFARNLTAGWWSWGVEALLFQHKTWWVDEEHATDDVGQGPVGMEK